MLSREQLRAVKKMSLSELDNFLQGLYKQAFLEGLEEGEKEFSDAIIMTEDEAREKGLRLEEDT